MFAAIFIGGKMPIKRWKAQGKKVFDGGNLLTSGYTREKLVTNSRRDCREKKLGGEKTIWVKKNVPHTHWKNELAKYEGL